MNKITRRTPIPGGINFADLIDDFDCHSSDHHRRGSSFWRQSIVKIDADYFPELPEEFYGYWETNEYSYDSEYGPEKREIIELKRVEKVKVVIETFEWVEVK